MFQNFVSDKFFANNQKRNILFLITDFVFSKLILFQNLLQFFVSETKNVKSKRKPYLRNEKRSKISFQMGKCIKGHTQSYSAKIFLTGQAHKVLVTWRRKTFEVTGNTSVKAVLRGICGGNCPGRPAKRALQQLHKLRKSDFRRKDID